MESLQEDTSACLVTYQWSHFLITIMSGIRISAIVECAHHQNMAGAKIPCYQHTGNSNSRQANWMGQKLGSSW